MRQHKIQIKSIYNTKICRLQAFQHITIHESDSHVFYVKDMEKFNVQQSTMIMPDGRATQIAKHSYTRMTHVFVITELPIFLLIL